MQRAIRMPTNPQDILRERDFAPPAAGEQLQKLIDIISRSQQGFRELIDHLDQAVFTLTLEGEIRVANVRFSEIIGVPFACLIGHNVREFVAEPTEECISNGLREFVKVGTWSGRVPVRLKRSNELLYFDCFLQAIAESGRVVLVSGWARDVTALRDGERRSMELFESLHEGILFSTPAGQILDANPALVRMLGYSSKEELQGRNLSELYLEPSHRSALISEIDATGSVQDAEIVLVRKGGKEIHCLGSARAIRDASGAFVRIQATLRDVTEQRLMEHELHKEREFGRRLIACFPDVIALLDSESRFTYVSESVRTVLGYPASHFIGQRLGSHSEGQDRAKLDAMMQGLLSGAASRGQVEVQTQHADGTPRAFRISAAPLLDETGRITGIVTSGRDVTESNLLDRQLVQREKFAAMGQMLAGAAHELNNPLTAILGVSDLLAEAAQEQVTRRQAGLILKQARRAADIVQNLLAFSRPRASGLQPLRVEEVIQHILSTRRTTFEQKGISAKFDPAPNLPSVEGDRKLLMQVFSNILVNAEQAISVGNGTGTISVTIRVAGDRLCITFANDGPAIPSENISKLFDPFFTTKRPGGGSGLGLTICLAIVKDHGGTIEVDSQQSRGASFRIYLPSAGCEPMKASAPNSSTPPVPSSEQRTHVISSPDEARPATGRGKIVPALHGRSIVVIDDEESILEILQEGLSIRGLNVKGFLKSEDALAHLKKNASEVVLCDFNMPGMKGNDIFDRVRAFGREQTPRFIFMTGELVESEAIAELRKQGALTLQKPFNIPAVTDILLTLFPSIR